MSANRRQAERDSFREVPETCPYVDEAMNEATRIIKEQTGSLRSALVDAIERANESEETIEALRAEIASLREELESSREAA